MKLLSRIFGQKEQPQKATARRAFAAAKLGRLNADWLLQNTSPNAELNQALHTLRARSRDLCQNNDYAKGALKKARTNIIGPWGIQLQMGVKLPGGDDNELDDVTNRMIERAWEAWGKKGMCTVDRMLSWIDVQQMVQGCILRDGEVLVRIVRGFKGNPFRFALQVLEADHLDERYNDELSNGNIVRMGVELDEWNAPVAYYLLTEHPGDSFYRQRSTRKRVRVPASDILHLYDIERPAQARGIPAMAAGMQKLKMLDGYMEAEVVASRAAASKMAVLQQIPGQNGEYVGDGEDEEGNTITEIEPGTVEKMPAGYELKPIDWNHPTSQFNTFVKGCLRSFSTGVGMSYNNLANDLEGVNYSSIRQGALEERDQWRTMQVWIIEHLCEPVFAEWLDMAIVSNQLALPATRIAEFNKPIFRPRGWAWIDPLKEVNAARQAIDGNLKSASEVVAEQGGGIEEVYRDLAREQTLREKFKLTAGAPTPPAPEEDKEDDKPAGT